MRHVVEELPEAGANLKVFPFTFAKYPAFWNRVRCINFATEFTQRSDRSHLRCVGLEPAPRYRYPQEEIWRDVASGLEEAERKDLRSCGRLRKLRRLARSVWDVLRGSKRVPATFHRVTKCLKTSWALPEAETSYSTPNGRPPTTSCEIEHG